MYVLIENTPGYLPESEPLEFEDEKEAIQAAIDRVVQLTLEYAETREAPQMGWYEAEPNRLWRVFSTDTHTLDRVVEIQER